MGEREGLRAQSLLDKKPPQLLLFRTNAEYAPAGTMRWIAEVEAFLRGLAAGRSDG